MDNIIIWFYTNFNDRVLRSLKQKERQTKYIQKFIST